MGAELCARCNRVDVDVEGALELAATSIADMVVEEGKDMLGIMII